MASGYGARGRDGSHRGHEGHEVFKEFRKEVELEIRDKSGRRFLTCDAGCARAQPTTPPATSHSPLPPQRGNITDPGDDQREDHGTPEQAGSNISGAIGG